MGRIVSPQELTALRAEWRRSGSRVVLACGAFDLLHPGHVRLLEQARSFGDVLIVALESDEAVRAALVRHPKNLPTADLRPVVPQAERAEILAALAAVDFVVVRPPGAGEDWFAAFEPDAMAQGGVVERALEETAAGPRMVRIPLEPGYSTELLMQRARQLPQ